MSFPVTTAAIQLPLYGEPCIVVNDGSDVVYIGVRRDTLTADGFPLQPLAQLTLDGVTQYYAQANSGTQALDMLPGGLGFAPSPGQIAAQIVASTLAQAISVDIANSALASNTATAGYNQGTRLVDNTSIQTTFGGAIAAGASNFLTSAGAFNGAVPSFIDVRGFHSYNILYNNDVIAAEIQLGWSDTNNNTLMTRTYEIGPGATVALADNHYGPFMWIVVKNVAAGNGNIGGWFRMSNRVETGERIDNIAVDNVSTWGKEGLVFVGTGTVAAGATSATFILPPGLGKYGIVLGLGFAAQFKFAYGVAQPGGQRLLAYTPAPQNVYFELPSLRRPMYCNLKSTDASSSTYGLAVAQILGR